MKRRLFAATSVLILLASTIALATPMYNAFTTEATLAAYSSLPARVDLMARNPSTGEGAQRSARLDWSEYDLADFDELNDILWKAIKGDQRRSTDARAGSQGIAGTVVRIVQSQAPQKYAGKDPSWSFSARPCG
jgi:hypothetical protein